MCIHDTTYPGIYHQRSFRADLSLHWEDSDTVAREMFSNVQLVPHDDADDADLFL